MKKIKQLFRKGVALALAAVTTLSVLPAATVSAASQRATITFAYCYDGNGNTIRYQQTASHNGITFSHAGEARTRIYADGDNAYCIEQRLWIARAFLATLRQLVREKSLKPFYKKRR